MTTRSLYSIRDFASRGPFSESQLRWYVFNADRNGMTAAGALVRLSRRVYIDAEGFDRWILAQNPTLLAIDRSALKAVFP